MNFLRKWLKLWLILGILLLMTKLDVGLLSTQELLDTRIKDLCLELPLKYTAQIEKLKLRLQSKNINWTPHFWASDEWFSPDGIAGIAYPFILCHPKLIRLEKKYLGFCEGESTAEFFKLLAHEAGHAIDNAFGLRRKKLRQNLFGISSKKYPSSYRPNPNSKDFVIHLSDYYAQAHPDEDWAETFAVWLTTDNWKKRYKHTLALKKLEYVADQMQNLRSPKQSLRQYKAAVNDTRTVREYLVEKQKNLKLNRKNFYTRKLNSKHFSVDGVSAALYIQQNKKQIIQQIKKDNWIIEKCLRELKDECKKQKYKLNYNHKSSQKLIVDILDQNYDEFIKRGRTRVYM